uniref:Uncharacterized protein LOC111111984 n=1 Tax=Crassostrea virginica TaxID=6565 RepID=A0A8B8BNJ1_CRAVI|nr:uncharacterized protein LOC111111984 [Crassostrea virginica]
MASLENHLLLGDCSVRSEKKLLDKCKTMYQDKLDKLVHVNNKTLDSDDANTSIVSQTEERGWALKTKKPKVFFTKDQKQYLIEKFNLGKVTGNKEDPAQVSRDMPYALQDGKKRFNREHYLTAGQVASFFSRLAMKDRKGDNQDAEDFRAASADRKLFSLREKVLSQV